MGFFHLIDKIADFLHNKRFFSDSPEGFALLLGQCAAWRSLAQSITPFLASGKAKNEVFSLRIAHIAPSLCFCTKEIFRMVPEGLNAFGTFVHAAESAN